MKTLLIALISVFFMTITLTATDAAVKTAVYKCSEVNCSGCQKHITEAVNTLEGIKKVNVDLKTKLVTVEYDDSKTTPEQIKAAIEDAGYETEAVS
jgi:copper chaperone CopZ